MTEEIAKPEVAPTPVTIVNTPPVITEENANSFTSEQIKEFVERSKAEKKPEPIKEEAKPEVKAEAPKEETRIEPPKEEVKVDKVEPVIEPSFDEKVAKAVEAKIAELGIKKEEPVPVKPEEEFHGFKTAEELQAAYEKDPVGTFNKVVTKQVKAEMESFKAEVNKSLNPIKADLESRTINTHLGEAKSKIKEFADPKFAESVSKIIKDQKFVDRAVSDGKNPYIEAAKQVRAERIDDYEKAAYDRGVKETEARLAKANRAVVEGGGKVQVETEGIDLDKASSKQIFEELKRQGKAY